MSFDPYQQWFGIPPSEQPPSLYRLLGVEEFEADPDKLHRAALERIAALRKHQAGKHSDLSQQLMNEVSQARIILLDPQRKAEYDLTLAAGSHEDSRPERPHSGRGLSIVAVAAVVLLLAAGTTFLVLSRSNPLSPGTSPDPAENAPPLALAPASESEVKTPSESAAAVQPQPSATEADPKAEPKVAPQPKQASEAKPAPTQPFTPEELAASPGTTAIDFLEEASARYLFANPINAATAERGERLVTYTVEPTRTQTYFLPVPEGDFRLLLLLPGVELKDQQNVSLGLYRTPQSFLGMSLRRRGDGLVVSMPKSAASTSEHVFHPVQGKAVWWKLGREKGKLYVAFSDGRRQWTRQDSDVALDPVVIGFTIDNPGPAPLPIPLQAFRLETASDGYASQLEIWPPVSLRPSSAVLDKVFAGELHLTPVGLDSIEYTPSHPSGVEAMGGSLSEDGLAILVPPETVINHGPFSDIRAIEVLVQCTARAKLEFRFSGGGSIQLDAARQQVRFGKQPPQSVLFPLGQWNDLRITIDDLGNVGLIVKGRLTHTKGVAGLTGTMATHVSGVEPVMIRKLRIDGRVNLLSMWMEALAGTENALMDPENMPVVQPKGPFTLLQPSEGTPEPWELEVGRPVPLSFLNTEADESHPFLEGDGLTLHFTRSTDEDVQLLAGRREDVNVFFSELAKVNGIPEDGNQAGVTLSPDSLTVIFSSNHEGGAARLYLSRRESPDDAFPPATKLPFFEKDAAAGALVEPLLAPNGSLYFTLRNRDVVKIHRADPNDQGEFTSAAPVDGIPASYCRATLMADDQTLYLQGPVKGGSQTIFRSWRRATSSEWITPKAVREVKGGKRGAYAPFVTPDGQFLFFASDREGGKGGLDLWVMRLREPEADAAVAAVNRASQLQPVSGPIQQWLTVGPFDPKEIPNSSTASGLRDFAPSKVFRDVPPIGEELAGKQWFLGKPANEAGVYLVVLPLDLQKSAELRLHLRSAPGGTFFWLDRKPAINSIAANPFAQGGPVNQQSQSFKLFRGKHRIVGVVCVGQPDAPLDLRVIDSATEGQVDGLHSELPVPAE